VGGTCGTNGEKRNAYSFLIGKAEGWRRLGRPRLRWLDNIEMALVEIRWRGKDWIGMTHDRYWWGAIVNAVMNLWVL
jgi:hypothetical protein